jgi:hypothetical protein
MLLSLIKPTLEIFQHLHALRDRLVIHGVLPFAWSVREVLRWRLRCRQALPALFIAGAVPVVRMITADRP